MDATAASVDATAESSANSYAILAKLATGGMAELFLARTASSAGVERYVVLKRVLPHRLHDHHFVSMFLDEARLAAQLQHPNIAQVFDTGKLGDSYFFSMEYVHGETVRELAYRAYELGEAIPLGCVLTIAASAAAGLHHAHERLGLDGTPLGIVHRDVSPSNLMVSYEGNVKLVDFGVAKMTDRTVETQTGTVKGKISYLSPEQCRGRVADRRSDLFSLGIVLWELLVGDRLYKRDSDYDAMETIVHELPAPPSQFRAEVPAELDAVVMKLLAKAPGDRYQTADELYDELEHLADRHAIRMSNAALKRFMVELFGKRPEPWIELRTRDTAAEVITVSAAIAGRDSTLTVLDSQLLKVFDLTSTRTPEHPATRAVPAPTPIPAEDAPARTQSRVPWLVAGAA
ncbi:MAG TPA: serine/threonine-protein kinase, partial [Kofleriaceae bacterium]|nr:serine/threonine-protein kinase [Kofleriaceae bacterium]